jgi:SAM-dependent methyltransferase
MYREALPVLRCPACTTPSLSLLGPLYQADEIVAGALRCGFCHTQTAIQDGIWDALGDSPVARTPAQVTNYLSLTASAYEPLWRWQALSRLSGRRFPLQEEQALLRGLVQPRAEQVYLDVACSAGLYARMLAQPGVAVVGVDHSWAMLRAARRLALQSGLRISYIRATAQALPILNGTVAGVGMGGSLNEIGDQHTALCEIRRVLQPGGRFFCMNLVGAESGWGRALQRSLSPGGVVFPPPTVLQRWFDRAGLRRRAQWRWRVVMITLLERSDQP